MRVINLCLVAATAGLTGSSVAFEREEVAQVQENAAAPGAAAAVNTRYDGYEFLDADGHPLPFQTDEEIEHYLSTSSVVSVTKIPVGISRPTKVLLAGDAIRLHAVFKDIDDERRNVRDPSVKGRGGLYLIWRDSYIYDVAAYKVDRLLGLDRIAPIVIRKLKGDKGSLQIWVEGTITENNRRQKGYQPPEIARFNQQRETLRVFDNLVANRDANLGNTLIDGNWRLWFIDCSRCFGTSDELLYPEAITHCDRQMWNGLKSLDRSTADDVLSPYLSRGELNALFKRRDKIVDKLQAAIDEWGEELILFDQRPPTQQAPWVGSPP
jgi:hypothetical protein